MKTSDSERNQGFESLPLRHLFFVSVVKQHIFITLAFGGLLKWLRGSPAKGVGRETGARVQIPCPPPSRGYKKDIAKENPDFIGVFRCLYGHFSGCKIIDVKRRFSLCGEFRTQTKPNIFNAGAWNRKIHAPFSV